MTARENLRRLAMVGLVDNAHNRQLADAKLDAYRDEILAETTSSLHLPPRLHDILQALAAGENLPETAARLHISEDTVKTHRRRLYQRLGARSGAHAVAIASRIGLPLPIAVTEAVAS
jgi:DNA-binding NarL/FixJ family response regulator